jgi:hypothetical protein
METDSAIKREFSNFKNKRQRDFKITSCQLKNYNNLLGIVSPA